jgi:hypothetical protein
MIALLKVNCQLAVCIQTYALLANLEYFKKPNDKPPDL